MAIRPTIVKQEEENIRLYAATATWKEEDGKIYRQEFVIAAKNKENATHIAHNHVPARLTRTITPNPADKVKIQVMDYGILQQNRTYYSSPILPNEYKKVMPGPIKGMPVAENSEPDIEPEKPDIEKSKTDIQNETKSETPNISEPPKSDTTSETDTNQPEIKHVDMPSIPINIYGWSIMFTMLWGSEIGKLIQFNEETDIPEDVADNIVKMTRLPNLAKLMRQWGEEFAKEVQNMGQISAMEANAKSQPFFYRKLAEWFDSQAIVEKPSNDEPDPTPETSSEETESIPADDTTSDTSNKTSEPSESPDDTDTHTKSESPSEDTSEPELEPDDMPLPDVDTIYKTETHSENQEEDNHE